MAGNWVNCDIQFISSQYEFHGHIYHEICDNVYHVAVQKVNAYNFFELYVFPSRKEALKFSDKFGGFQSYAIKKNFILGKVNGQYCLCNQLHNSEPYVTWVAKINPWKIGCRGNYDLDEKAKGLLCGIAEAMKELNDSGYCYGLSLQNTIQIGDHNRLIMVASAISQDGVESIHNDVKEFGVLVQDLIQRQSGQQALTFEFCKLLGMANNYNELIKMRSFANYFYQNPLTFTNEQRITFVYKTDKLKRDHKSEFQRLRFGETSMNGWQNNAPKLGLFAFSSSDAFTYAKTESFIAYRRNAGAHNKTRANNEAAEEEYSEYFPQTCFAIFNAILSDYQRGNSDIFVKLLDRDTSRLI